MSRIFLVLCLFLLIPSCINKPEKEPGHLYLRLSTNPTSLDPALIVDVTGGADYPDPENFLFPLFHSSNFGPGGNRTRFVDSEVDSLIEKGQRSIDQKKRDDYYQRAEARIVEAMPWVFFWHRTEFTIRQPWVKNYEIYPIYSIDKGMEVSMN